MMILTPLAVVAQSRPQPSTGGTVRPVTGDPARGKYLAEHVAMCVECHSTRDAEGHILPNGHYMGGAFPLGPQWASSEWATRVPRNAGLPGYSDAEALRLLMEGAIGRQGEQLKLPMPRFRMNLQDASDIIAFLRTLP